jgi:hypothetical protein
LLENKKIDIFFVLFSITVIIAYAIFRMNVFIPVNNYSLKTSFMGLYSVKVVFSWFMSTFGILTFFTLSRIWFSKLTLSLTPLLVLTFVSTLFATDKERTLIYAFPLVILSVIGFRVQPKKETILTLAPILIYALLELLQAQYKIRFIYFSISEFVIFVIIEFFFLREYFKNNQRVHAIVTQVGQFAARK